MIGLGGTMLAANISLFEVLIVLLIVLLVVVLVKALR